MSRAAAIRMTGWLLAIAVLATPVVAVLRGWLAARQWPVRFVTVEGPDLHVPATSVVQTLQPLLQHGFFAVDLQRVRAVVAALPWAAQVEVRKHWPDTLVVRLQEHEPWARWTRDRLVGSRGDLFTVPASQMPPTLPVFEGPPGSLPEVVAFYRDAEGACAQHGLHVISVQLTARGSYTLGLAGGARIVVGRGHAAQRLDRFLAVWPQLAARHAQMFVYADLRYANGFAVRWPQLVPIAPVLPSNAHGTGNA